MHFERQMCVIQLGPPIKDQVLCQLSDSDHIQHPEDLVTREGFVYQNSEVRYFDCIRFYVNLWLSLCYFLFIYPFHEKTNPSELQTEA